MKQTSNFSSENFFDADNCKCTMRVYRLCVCVCVCNVNVYWCSQRRKFVLWRDKMDPCGFGGDNRHMCALYIMAICVWFVVFSSIVHVFVFIRHSGEEFYVMNRPIAHRLPVKSLSLLWSIFFSHNKNFEIKNHQSQFVQSVWAGSPLNRAIHVNLCVNYSYG